MISLHDALEHVLATVPVHPVLDVSVPDALGLVIAADVVAGESVPGWDNTALDGFAVRAGDVAVDGERVTTTFAPGRTVTGTLGGPAVPWTSDSGKPVQVAFSMVKGRLVQVYTAEDGGRRSVYTLDDTGARGALDALRREVAAQWRAGRAPLGPRAFGTLLADTARP